MLHDAPPGTGLILSALGIVISLSLVIILIYSWVVMGSQNIAMSILGLIVFILIMVVVAQTRSGSEEDEKEEDGEQEGGLYDDI